jgi:hypothetical protein
MNREVKILEYIRRWSLAKQDANENASMIVRNSSAEVMDECARRMRVLQAAEDDMLSSGAKPGFPSPLIQYIDARIDKGCMHCWLSSRGPTHDECGPKISRFFRTQEALYLFGLNVQLTDETGGE